MSARRRKAGKTPLQPMPLLRKIEDAATPESRGWPEGYVESFAGLTEDFKRPLQGVLEKRETFD